MTYYWPKWEEYNKLTDKQKEEFNFRFKPSSKLVSISDKFLWGLSICMCIQLAIMTLSLATYNTDSLNSFFPYILEWLLLSRKVLDVVILATFVEIIFVVFHKVYMTIKVKKWLKERLR